MNRQQSSLVSKVIANLRIGQPTAEEKQTFRGLVENAKETSKATQLYHAPTDTFLKVK